MSTLDITNMTDEQLAVVLAEARKREMAKSKSEKYAKFEPTYSEYRKAVAESKKAKDLKKSLLADLRKLGFGKKAEKVKSPTTKGGKRK
jgi:hypothetical protein